MLSGFVAVQTNSESGNALETPTPHLPPSYHLLPEGFGICSSHPPLAETLFLCAFVETGGLEMHTGKNMDIIRVVCLCNMRIADTLL